MSSQRKVEANRRNAQKSTGSKTPEGKARSSMNAVKHGATARRALVPGESQEDFDQHVKAFEDDHQPASAQEAALVRELALLDWRIQRMFRVETGIFRTGFALSYDCYDHLRNPDSPEDEATNLLATAFRDKGESFDRLCRYEAHLRRHSQRTLEQLLRFRKERAGRKPAPEPEPGPVERSFPAPVAKSNSPAIIEIAKNCETKPTPASLAGLSPSTPLPEELKGQLIELLRSLREAAGKGSRTEIVLSPTPAPSRGGPRRSSA